MIFNHKSRKKNVIQSSFVGAVCYAFNMVMNLAYRMFFLRILTVEYLGISGLFANILGLLQIAELGIAVSIIYRLYEPLSTENTRRVGELMRHYRKVYHLIAFVILCLGCVICPFIYSFIRDISEIPADVNLYVVYLLLLFQTSASYLFSYRISLLNADQKQYQVTIITTISTFIRYTVQLIVLFVTSNYTITLTSGIVIILVVNWSAGLWIGRQYPQVFKVKTELPVEERKGIFKDTQAVLFHKIGATMLTSTDSILLSKFMGITATGLYSIYSMIIAGISGVINVLLEPLTPSLGNAHVTLNDEEKYRVFRKAMFLNHWVVGLILCCLYNLINDFIILWLREELFLDSLTVLLLCLQFYFESMRKVSIQYTISCELVSKDKIRPVIEVILNIVVSIICLKKFGTAGIFMGTLFSYFATVFWREPYLLYRYVFHKELSEYWKVYCKNVAITIIATLISWKLKFWIFERRVSIGTWVMSGFLCAFVYIVLHSLLFFQSEDFHYYFRSLINLIRRYISQIRFNNPSSRRNKTNITEK